MSNTRKVGVETCACCTCTVHMPLLSYGGCVWGAYRILVNQTSGGSRQL